MKKAFTGFLCSGVVAFALIIMPAVAAQDCPMTYETFEVAVPHIDLESCPETMAMDGTFCRATVGGDRVHIFSFAETDDQCLRQVKSFDEESFTLTVEPQ